MKSLSLRKTLVFLGAVAALSLVNAQSALAASEMPKDMSCQEFINLNPKAMTPVAWWMLHEETVYKGGDTVTLNETDLTQIPQVIEYCKKNPEKNLYTFKEKNANVLPN
ncbi:acid-activated periplasmic chaperone HdeB [Escherichia fergusonii]|uniref:acid-activated periplasmic chaperone HdeB n=1 Tax=Escherichia fergusonii TaxID=564 RepID=UPI001ED0F42D|nr:acid-activated periplasmic chaperone HdeB [Escherichia fergusonii]EHJ4134111.1 acid-activated periplasmic chaperone HdeB [Escherichia fergusonii]